jgi:hypothetical protein
LEMGQRTGSIDFIEQASKVFRQVGATVFLSFALHSLAQLRSQSCADTAAVILDYTKAIVALDEVKADYQLGIACTRRAHLYEQVGQPDSARFDLKKARDCFEGVGTSSELVEVAREANAGSRSAAAMSN